MRLRHAGVVLLLLAATSCNRGGGDSANTIKIVSSLPMQGSAQAQTQTIVNGIRMALEDAGGQVDGWRIVYEPWDDASAQRANWDAQVEANNARRAAEDQSILTYVGTYNSGAAKISMPILNEAGLLMISPANTYVGLTKSAGAEPGEPAVYRPTGEINYFRVVPADDIQGRVGARWAHQQGIQSTFVLDDGELYGRGIADVFERECRALGIAVAGRDRIDARATDYRALAGRIREANVGLVYFGGTTQSNAGQLIRDLRAEGVTCPIMVPDGCFESAFIASAGPENLNDRTWVTFGGVPPEQLTGRGADFYQRYRERYGSDPEVYSVYGYEAVNVVLECIRRALPEPTRASVLEACRTLGDFDGTLGQWRFDANGDTSLTTMSINRVANGDFEFIQTLDLSAE